MSFGMLILGSSYRKPLYTRPPTFTALSKCGCVDPHRGAPRGAGSDNDGKRGAAEHRRGWWRIYSTAGRAGEAAGAGAGQGTRHCRGSPQGVPFCFPRVIYFPPVYTSQYPCFVRSDKPVPSRNACAQLMLAPNVSELKCGSHSPQAGASLAVHSAGGAYRFTCRPYDTPLPAPSPLPLPPRSMRVWRTGHRSGCARRPRYYSCSALPTSFFILLSCSPLLFCCC